VSRSPRSALNSAPDSRTVEMGEAQKKHRRRSGSRGTTRRIQAAARERQAAWLETGHPLLTYRLTLELNRLYGDLRDERKGDPGEPYKGNTMRLST